MNQAEIAQHVSTIFNKLSLNHSDYFSRESILMFLDQQSNKMYDRVLFDQLYARMPKTNQGYVSITDFIAILMEAFRSLRNKIQILEQQINNKEQTLSQYQTQLQQMQNNEQFNQYNICVGSTLRITIHNAIVQFPGNSRVAIIVGCGLQKKHTNSANRQAPQWEQIFEFQIENGKEEIYLVLMDEELTERQEIGGQTTIELQDFKDQKSHELTLDLKDRYGVVQYGTINIKVQWIYSQTKYFQDSIKESQLLLDELHQDLQEYRSDIITLFYPFDEKNEQKQLQLLSEQSTIQQIHDFQFPDSQNVENWVYYGFYFTGIFLISTLLCNLFKTQFLDHLITFYSLWYYMNNNRLVSLLHFKIISFMLIISIGLDIGWFVIFTQPWSTNSVLYMRIEHSLQLYEVVVCYLHLFIKVCLIGIYGQIYLVSPNKRQNIYDAQYELFFGERSNDLYSFQNTRSYLHQSIN